ncbi:hypothetical protein DUI87_07076 [Hirundo rustica rustica]|uniref:Uncharacterized protein n=1 Tax=Hirundo rustica rustica TaxID=333673 RepID=A0A3M0KNT7_HIRRU|nr:hypothetical protein DUI87_07076 [Hirundo rustica rustica]
MTAPADEAVPPAPSTSFKMSGGPRISFNAIDSALSSLKNCQSYIDSGMDVATQVALDLVESFNDEEDVNNMEKVMLEYATMDRELNHYIKAFEETINQNKQNVDIGFNRYDLGRIVEEINM